MTEQLGSKEHLLHELGTLKGCLEQENGVCEVCKLTERQIEHILQEAREQDRLAEVEAEMMN
jgi:hypothetical protein